VNPILLPRFQRLLKHFCQLSSFIFLGFIVPNTNFLTQVRFQILTAVGTMITVFWYTAPWNLFKDYTDVSDLRTMSIIRAVMKETLVYFNEILPNQQFYFLRLHRSQHQLPYPSKISDSRGCRNEDYSLLVYSAMTSL
jgi:hypothetical protein